MKFIYSSSALWTILFSIKTLPRLQPSTCNVLKAAGIAKKVTRRGSRGGINLKRKITVVHGNGKYNYFGSYNNYISFGRNDSFIQNDNMQISTKAPNSNTGNNASLAVHSLSNGLMNTDTTASSGVNYNNLTYIKCINGRLASNKQCSFRLLNCRSVCNKTDTIKDFVVDNDIDILAITETWLRPSNLDSLTIGDLTPTGYQFHHVARDTRGGGVGLLHKSSLNFHKDSVDSIGNFQSFEAAGMKLHWRSTSMHILIIYRPPSSNCILFLTEFGSLLEHYITTPGALMITGDFNLHLDNKSDPTCNNFLQLLESLNLRQHVREPTHRSGHTLDLIITREDENIIGPVSVTESIISDHSIVNCSLNLLKPTLMKRCISSRKIKSIDIERLKSDICDSLGPNTDISIDVNDLVSRYCSELTRIMDIHAPLKKRHVVIRPAAPWYNDEIKDAKRLRRRLERRWRRSRDPVDHSNFVKQCRAVTDLLLTSIFTIRLLHGSY